MLAKPTDWLSEKVKTTFSKACLINLKLRENAMIKYNLCEISFTGSYTRVRVDLLKISRKGVRPCPHVSPPKLTEFKTMDNEATLKMQNSKEKKMKIKLYLILKRKKLVTAPFS